MTNPVVIPQIPERRASMRGLALTAAALLLLGGSAHAEPGASPPPAERVIAAATSGPGVGPPGADITRTVDAADAADDSAKRWSASLTVETSIGIGTFVSEPQDQSLVVTSFSPSGAYDLGDSLSVAASFAVSWYQVLDFNTPLEKNQILLSDINLALAHSSIWKHEDSGFNLSGALAIALPTSLASQFQNRLFTLKPSLTASIPVGPVSFSYTFAFGKYFNLTAAATVDCDDFANPDDCREGRADNPDFGFESERRGAEVYLPGGGSSSYYFQNSFSVRWAIIEGLSLALGVGIFNTFGTRSFESDGLTSDNASAGRSQADRLVSSLALSYQIIRQLSVGASLVTATGRPFGAQGNDFVIFDFSRAPDNITSINFSVTGSL